MDVHDHWAADLIGLPYKAGGRGPREFDCLGLVQHVVRLRLGVELPTVEQIHGSRWRRAVDAPREMDVVLLWERSGRHIGIFVQANGTLGLLHAGHQTGVVFQPLGEVLENGRGNSERWRHT